MSLCLAYSIEWMKKWLRIPTLATLFLVSAFGFSPYIATYSIAMWKDPIFASAIVILSLKLMDVVLTQGTAVARKGWIVGYSAIAFTVVFSRNNGFIVMVLSLAALLLLHFRYSRLDSNCADNKKCLKTICLCTAAIILSSAIITGPVYKAIPVQTASKAESTGVLLNQMARVAALQGEMSDSDLKYMDSILPIELYKTTYRPCCTDLLKWDPSFSNDALESDFYTHWFSMFVKNPRVYFEAWELQTCGFWAINQPTINQNDWNVSGGVPRNTSQTQDIQTQFDIHPKNALGSEAVRDFLPLDEWSIPISCIHWLLLIGGVFLILLRKRDWIIPLTPSYAIMLTLIMASPIAYWPRYGFAEQLLLPFYLFLFFLIAAKNRNLS